MTRLAVGLSLAALCFVAAFGEDSAPEVVVAVDGAAVENTGDRSGEVSDETGMVEDHEADAMIAAAARADLEITATAGEPVGGVVDVTATFRSLDKPDLGEPTVSFTMSHGVAPVSLPDGCSQDGSVVTCVPTLFFTGPVPSEPIVVEFQVIVDEGAVDPSVTVTATSFDNPVSNDPDPSNNTATITL